MALAVLLSGLPCSGKTTLGQRLARHGFVHLSVDEEVYRAHGRYGVDFPEDSYSARRRQAVETLWERLVKELAAGNHAVFESGLWRRNERDLWKLIVRTAHGQPVLVHLPAERDVLLARLSKRNKRSDANAMPVTPEILDNYLARFEPPTDDEEAIVYNGDEAALLDRLLVLAGATSPGPATPQSGGG